MTRFSKRIIRAWLDDSGVASIEFVMAVPVLMAVFMASFESGLFMTRKIMLEQSVDIVMRELRLGHYTGTVTTDTLKTEICKRTVVFNNCASNMMIELTRISTSDSVMPTASVQCRDLSLPIAAVTTLQVGAENDLMLVRACIVVDALFPTTGVGLKLNRTTSGGGIEIVAMSAFSNEPS